MIKVSEVFDGEKLIAVELELGNEVYFYSLAQDQWPGLRAGTVPCASDGTQYQRIVKYQCEAGKIEDET